MTDLLRTVAGVALFGLGAWASPYLADVLGISPTIVYLVFGGVLSFVGGMLFYSGARPWY